MTEQTGSQLAGPTTGAENAPPTIGIDEHTARSAVDVAVHAPSILNTQPWRWRLVGGVLQLWADPARHLPELDPDGHSLVVSCGAALQLCTTALAADGWRLAVDRRDDAAPYSGLLAEVRAVGHGEAHLDDAARIAAARQRHTERRPFASTAPAAWLIDFLARTGTGDGVRTEMPLTHDETIAVSVVVGWTERIARANERLQVEIASWIRHSNHAEDGIPAAALPRVAAARPRHTEVSVGDYTFGSGGALHLPSGVDEHSVLAVVRTIEDGPADRLRAGEALMRVLLEAHRNGLGSCIVAQSFGLPAGRAMLRDALNTQAYPQTMLRLGVAPGGRPVVASPRRSVDDVLDIAAKPARDQR